VTLTFTGDALRAKPAAEWERVFGSLKIPAVRTQTTKEWLFSEHSRASGLVMEVNDATHGPMLQASLKRFGKGRQTSPCLLKLL